MTRRGEVHRSGKTFPILEGSPRGVRLHPLRQWKVFDAGSTRKMSTWMVPTGHVTSNAAYSVIVITIVHV